MRPRVRFSTPEQVEQASAPATVPEPVPEEPQGFRRYQTRMGPRAPSPVPQRSYQVRKKIQFLYEVINGKVVDYALVIWYVMRYSLSFLTENRHILFLTLVTNLVEVVISAQKVLF